MSAPLNSPLEDPNPDPVPIVVKGSQRCSWDGTIWRPAAPLPDVVPIVVKGSQKCNWKRTNNSLTIASSLRNVATTLRELLATPECQQFMKDMDTARSGKN
jgi:hypothetical protein